MTIPTVISDRADPGQTMTGDRVVFADTPPQAASPYVVVNIDGARTPTTAPQDEDAPPEVGEDYAEITPWHGVLTIEGAMAGDRRLIDADALTWRDLPLPLRYQPADAEGHDGSVVVGRIDNIWRDGAELRAEGVFDTTEQAGETIRLLAEGMIRGVSVDLDAVELELRNGDGKPFDLETDELSAMVRAVTVGRIASAAICAIPAFQEAYVALGPWEEAAEDAEHEVEALVAALSEFAVSEKPWDGSAGRFTPEQWYRSCILHKNGRSLKKSDNALPIREPGGALSRAGVHAAAARINQVKGASPAAIASAKRALRGAYRQLGEEAPDSLALEQMAAGTRDGPGWITHPKATQRLRRYWTRGPGAAKIRWGAPGDFNRCRAQLGKYVAAPFLSGTCANLHKAALGFWPGQHHGLDAGADASMPAFTAAGIDCQECPGIVAAPGEVLPPAAWFDDPQLGGPTRLTVTEDGRVFGHVATWGTCHVGNPRGCTLPPKSSSQYAYFNIHPLLTDGGERFVGHLVFDTEHAPARAGMRDAMAHYGDTGARAAYIRVGEDEHGIWAAGCLREGLSQDQVRAISASGMSGDWRPVGSSGHELIAVNCVSVEGFPIPRYAIAAAAGGLGAVIVHGPMPDLHARRVGHARDVLRTARLDAARAALH